MKKTIKYIALFISNVLLIYLSVYWVKRNINYDAFFNNLHHVNLNAFFLCYVPFLLLYLGYGKRTSLLINGSFSNSVSVNLIGHGLNYLCPFKSSEVLKIYLARRYYNFSAYDLGAVTIFEKIFDLAFMCVLGLISIYYYTELNRHLLLLFFIMFSVGLILATKYRLVLNLLSKKSLRLSAIIKRFVTAIEGRQFQKKIISTALSTFSIWVLTIFHYYLFFQGNLLSFNFTLLDATVLLVVTSLSFAIPISIGSLGLFEAATIFYLKNKFELGSEHALVLAVVLHTSHLLVQVIGMIGCVMYNEVKLQFKTGNEGNVVIYNPASQ